MDWQRYSYLIFDFDGVLVETNEIRIQGFQVIFQDYPAKEVEQMLAFARRNGGISRYDKIRHFFNHIRGETIGEDQVNHWAQEYSRAVKQAVIDAKPVSGSLEFLKRYHRQFPFGLISASDQAELRDVCRQRQIDRYFVDILGSPALKAENIQCLLSGQGWKAEQCLFIGDTQNDLYAARQVGVDFLGRNSGMVDWTAFPGVERFTDFAELKTADNPRPQRAGM